MSSTRNKRKPTTSKGPVFLKKTRQNDSDTETTIPSSPIPSISNDRRPYKNPEYTKKKDKNLKQILTAEKNINWPPNTPIYSSIEAPPSLKPGNKYCDLTGLPANYTEPRTKIRYHSLVEYQKIQDIPDDVAREYIALRNVALETFLQ